MTNKSFHASGASTGRLAKPRRVCLTCLQTALPDENTCSCGGKIERFDSKAELRNYTELRLLEKAGKIHGLKVHPKYDLNVMDNYGSAATRVGTYSPDFSYIRGTELVIREVKPHKLVKRKRGGMIGLKAPILSADAALRIKLFKALWRYEVEVVE